MSDGPAPPRELRASSVTKRFGPRTVLGGVSFAVAPGEVHALLGPSGAGKTTLLRVLNLLEWPEGGSVLFHGEEVALRPGQARLGEAQHRARLSMALVPQKPVAFRMSVSENAAFGLRVRGTPEEEIAKRVEAALRPLGLASLAEAPARRLSGGEQQRLAFARAAVLSLEFLLLDEFSANLDPPNVKILEGAARAYAHDAGAGVVVVTHDLFQARRTADRVTLIVDGEVVESAPKEAFFASPADPRTQRFVAGELEA